MFNSRRKGYERKIIRLDGLPRDKRSTMMGWVTNGNRKKNPTHWNRETKCGMQKKQERENLVEPEICLLYSVHAAFSLGVSCT